MAVTIAHTYCWDYYATKFHIRDSQLQNPLPTDVPTPPSVPTHFADSNGVLFQMQLVRLLCDQYEKIKPSGAPSTFGCSARDFSNSAMASR